MVIVNHEELADITEYWTQADDHLLPEQTVNKRIGTPVNFIVHSLTDVNKQLKRGRPCFVDIVRDGIALYEAPDHPFEQPKALPPEEALAEAKASFEHWFPLAVHAQRVAKISRVDAVPRDAAFLLHQAVERLYHCTLLVLTLYSPKSHKLNFLRSQAERIAPTLIDAWPHDTRSAQRCFELLRRAYVDARYSPHYKISDDELEWLIERVAVLQTLVHEVCERQFDPSADLPL